MSKEVKRYALFASLRPEAIAFLPDEVVSARDYDALLAERDRLRDALGWYAEQASGCRKLGAGGDEFRHALDHDGGARARAALQGAQP